MKIFGVSAVWLVAAVVASLVGQTNVARSQPESLSRTAAVQSQLGRGTIRFLSPVDSADLTLEPSVSVRLTAPWSGKADLVVSIVPAAEKRGRELGTVRLRVVRRRTETVRVAISHSSLSGLKRCVPSQIVAKLVNRTGALVSFRRPVNLVPPQCGTFFASSSVWNTPLASDAAIDPNSAAVTGTLLSEVQRLDAEHYYPTINTTSYSVPIYTVSATQRRVPVTLDNSQAYANGLRATLQAGVPIPAGAEPAAGNDHHLLIWQPGTNTMWELEHAQNLDGAWHAGFGGEIPAESSSDGAFYSDTGIELGATGSGLALAGGLMTIPELERGAIDHALAFAVIEARRSVWALPASRSDGYDEAANAIPEGAHFRLPASLDIAAMHLPPLIAMMARAVQRYGMIVRDQSAAVAFYAQDPTPASGDPYETLLGSSPDRLARFPWKDLELMNMDLRTYDGKEVADSKAQMR